MQPQPCFSPTDEAGRELARHGSDAFPVGCYLDDLSPGRCPGTGMRNWSFCRWQTGSVQLSAAGLQLTLGPGEGAFLNSGVTHREARLGDGACVVPNLVFLPRLVWRRGGQRVLAELPAAAAGRPAPCLCAAATGRRVAERGPCRLCRRLGRRWTGLRPDMSSGCGPLCPR